MSEQEIQASVCCRQQYICLTEIPNVCPHTNNKDIKYGDFAMLGEIQFKQHVKVTDGDIISLRDNVLCRCLLIIFK
jgi:hypothetical protein